MNLPVTFWHNIGLILSEQTVNPMKSLVLVLVFVIASLNNANSTSMAQFTADEQMRIQLVVDGMVINQAPKYSVGITAPAGMHEVEIRYFDNDGHIINWYNDCFYSIEGFEIIFQLNVCHEELLEIDQNLIYADRWRKPNQVFKETLIAKNEDIEYFANKPQELVSFSNT